MILGQRAHLELKIDYEEWLPGDYDDIVLMLHRWGLSSSPQEVGWALAIDPDRRIRTVFECARGDAHSLRIHIPTLVGGIMASGGDRWAFIHNHPSGDPEPTGTDLATMEHLREVSFLCGLYLEDGVVVTTDPMRSWSMLAHGQYSPAAYGSITDKRNVEEPAILKMAREEGQLSVNP